MTSFQPAAFAASSDRVTRASPIPWLRNTGSTIKGPSSRAETSPMAIGVMAEAPTKSVPTRAAKLSAGSAGGGPRAGEGGEARRRSGGRRPGGAIGRTRESARAEHALVEAFDRLDVVVRRWL